MFLRAGHGTVEIELGWDSSPKIRFAPDSPLGGWREMDSNFQFRAKRAGVLTGLYRRRPSKVFAFPPKRPVSCARDRWFESVSLQRRVRREADFRSDVDKRRSNARRA